VLRDLGYPAIRRVVTGHDAQNNPRILMDAGAANSRSSSPGLVSTLVWSSNETPADIAVGASIVDMGNRQLGSVAPPNGTRFAIIDFPPGAPRAYHRTDTLDYVIVLEGTIELEIGEQTTQLKAGDIVIQRGTDHAWLNKSATRCRIAVIVIDGKPLGIGTPLGSGDTPKSA